MTVRITVAEIIGGHPNILKLEVVIFYIRSLKIITMHTTRMDFMHKVVTLNFVQKITILPILKNLYKN